MQETTPVTQTPVHTLRAENLVKRFGSRTVVNGVSFDVNTNEIVGLMGPNGAGKTTSFYMVVGLIAPNEGKIFIDNTEITHLPIYKRAHLGITYLPQEASVFRRLTVEDNIRAILELKEDQNGRKLTSEQIESRLTELLKDLQIEHLRTNMALSLSGGERRRTEIARALAADPQFILLDEPFAGVDPIAVNEIKRITRYLKSRGIGVLITDHNVRETLTICDRAYLMVQGQVVLSGTPDTIVNNEQARSVYLGEGFSL